MLVAVAIISFLLNILRNNNRDYSTNLTLFLDLTNVNFKLCLHLVSTL